MQTVESKLVTAGDNRNKAVLELTVNNHPGVMSHICGLFSRRVYNMEGILCMPIDDGRLSRVWIRVTGNGQLEQIAKQLRKLEDVQTVRYHEAEHEVFVQLEDYFRVS
ncbi:MAG: acetolactate synthase small subunit [Proteobacteria bacterium]|nr:acetolactate synthase small subunit [Pseudomonadota bacterium]MBU1715645.1 acetolactate synthase small subunit [Pseudomonadota bacterium]